MGETCTRPECSGGGTIDADGYCDECGLAPVPSAGGTGAAAPTPTLTGVTAATGPARCTRDCPGSIDADGYCDECGLAAEAAGAAGAALPAPRVSPDPSSGPSPSGAGSGRSGSARSGSARSGSARTMSGRSRSHRSARTGSGRSVSVRSSKGSAGTGRRGNLGAGLVTVPPVPRPDPAAAVLTDPEVPERKRFCSKCDSPVGRSKNDVPGRPDGFCTSCGTPYSFTPKLRGGDLVGGQYQVAGCLAHGGLGWIYLAVDRRVNDRWVVLKGLLDTGDEDALAVAIAERRFLAEVDHPNIVRIINFVEHPDLRSGSADGYIVMEYVGGRSLKDIANDRRTPDGRRDPLPVEQAVAYALEALPALGYLHDRGLVYCDFKVDNVIQSEDLLKIIDMGAVRRFDDDGPIYGTVGYQAPEIAADGPSPASDLYTVGRTLAVLSFDFQGYATTWRHELPGPEEVPLFARYESYYRLLLRATDPDPARRFGSAEEMAVQLTGVLREILALQDGRPRPAVSTLFGPETRIVDTELASAPPSAADAALALPVPRVDTADPNAGFLAALAVGTPAEVLAALGTAPAPSLELRLRALRAHLELGDPDAAGRDLDAVEQDHPGDWRAVWYRGLAALTAGHAAAAAEAFDAVYDALPGESAPKLALAVCAELLGNREDAAEFYRLVAVTDRTYVGAAFGLARVRLAADDRPGAVDALEAVPESSAHHTAARIAAVRARLRDRPATDPLGPDLTRCSAQLTALGLDARRHEELSVEVLDAALGWVLAGRPGTPGGPAGGPAPDVLGHPAGERELRFALEHSYRVLARLSDRAETRIDMVERANRYRPRTWV